MREWQSQAHVKHYCKYHVVFVPKYRKKSIYGTLRKDIGGILRELCRQHGVAGLLTGIDVFLSAPADGTIDIWRGSPWQNGDSLYRTTFDSTGNGATYIDLSAADLTFQVNESFTYQLTSSTGSALLLGTQSDNYIGDLGYRGLDCWETCRLDFSFTTYVSTVPISSAVWLFGSGLIGLIGIARRKNLND